MIRIITDSTCDLTKADQEKLGITVIPLQVLFGTTQYTDGVDLTTEEFYQKLETEKELPTTTQINPDTFVNVFEEYLKQGDEIITILLSSHLSGTYQSAVIAKEMLETDKIHLIDSQNVTLGLALIVREAVKLRDNGLSAKDIVNKIEELKGQVRVVAIVDTLKYLQKGGRISAASAVVGTALGIKPIVQVKDGIVQVLGKERGQKKMYKFITSYLEENQIDTNYSVVYAHSMAEASLEPLKEMIQEKYEIKESSTVGIGSTVGTHVGPGAVGIAFVTK